MTTFSEITSAASDRVCRGVPIGPHGPAVVCESPLGADRFRLCPSCDAEIERRQRAASTASSDAGSRKLLESCGLSLPFVERRKSLDTIRLLSPEHEQTRDAVRQWVEWSEADGNTRGILLRGDLGIGKSDFAEAAVQLARLGGKPAKYVNARALVMRMQDANRDRAQESVRDILTAFACRDRALFLALDDLGATRMTRFAADQLYTLFEMRARDQLPTMIVTNYKSMADLAARLRPTDGGDDLDTLRPTDRILELCPVRITLTGNSLRRAVSSHSGWTATA